MKKTGLETLQCVPNVMKDVDIIVWETVASIPEFLMSLIIMRRLPLQLLWQYGVSLKILALILYENLMTSFINLK